MPCGIIKKNWTLGSGSMFIKNDWASFFEIEFEKPYMQELFEFLKLAYETQVIYPKKEDVFRAFELTPYKDVKVVILGQDPYHGQNQAHGLSFSVNDNVVFPPSLRNIFTELVSDIGGQTPTSGNLTAWAKQGVLLLNTTLTVQEANPMSHAKKGWETFTDDVLRYLNQHETPIVFVLWGKHAQTKSKLIDTSKHCVIKSAHPSPLSAYRGFFGSQPFSRINEFLVQENQSPINWSL